MGRGEDGVGETRARARLESMRLAGAGARVGGARARPEPLARERLVHEAQDDILALEQPDERAPKRRAHDEGARAVDRVDDPAEACVRAHLPQLLADEAVVGTACGDRAPDRALGGAVGGRHRIEGAVARLVRDGQRPAEIGADDGGGSVGELVREGEQGRERGGARHGCAPGRTSRQTSDGTEAREQSCKLGKACCALCCRVSPCVARSPQFNSQLSGGGLRPLPPETNKLIAQKRGGVGDSDDRRSPLGRFLPRLGPFVARTAFFRVARNACRELFVYFVYVSAALQNLHLKIVQCTLRFCGATSRARLACRSPPWAFPP